MWLILLRAPPRRSCPRRGTASGSARWPSATAATSTTSTRSWRRSGRSATRSSTCSPSSPTRRCSPTSTTTEPKGDHYYWRTEYLAELERRAARDHARAVRRLPDPRRASWASCTSAARSTSTPSDDGAVGNRDARYVIGVQRHVGARRARRPTSSGDWVRDAGERLRPFSTGGNYINFQTADEGDERDPRHLRRQLRPPRRGQAALRPGQPVPLEPQRPPVTRARADRRRRHRRAGAGASAGPRRRRGRGDRARRRAGGPPAPASTSPATPCARCARSASSRRVTRSRASASATTAAGCCARSTSPGCGRASGRAWPCTAPTCTRCCSRRRATCPCAAG